MQSRDLGLLTSCQNLFVGLELMYLASLKVIAHKSTMLQKFSKCEVKAAWCGIFPILLPLRFCVKSNFGELKRSILVGLNFDFGKS